MIRLNGVTRLIQREPVAFQGCVQATLAALVGFGLVNWSNEQLGLLMAVIAAFLAFFTRAAVSPAGKVEPSGPAADAAPAAKDAPVGGPVR
jgi:hypothetical protein